MSLSEDLMSTTSDRLESGPELSPEPEIDFAEELRFNDWNPDIRTNFDIKSDDLKTYEDRLLDFSAEIDYLLDRGTIAGERLDDDVSPSVLVKEILKTSRGADVASLFDDKLQEKVPDFKDNEVSAYNLAVGNLDHIVTASDIVGAMRRNLGEEKTHEVLDNMGLFPREESRMPSVREVEKMLGMFTHSLDF